MPHVDDDNVYMAAALIEGGNALASAIAGRYPDSETVKEWRELLAGDDEPTEELLTQLVEHGKRLRSVACDWLECPGASDEGDLNQFLEAISLWDTVQCDPENLPGTSAEDGGPAYH